MDQEKLERLFSEVPKTHVMRNEVAERNKKSGKRANGEDMCLPGMEQVR